MSSFFYKEKAMSNKNQMYQDLVEVVKVCTYTPGEGGVAGFPLLLLGQPGAGKTTLVKKISSRNNFKIGNPSSMPIEVIHAFASLFSSLAMAHQESFV